MSFLKQGVSLALVGAGMAMVPLTMADASASSPSSSSSHRELSPAKPGQVSHHAGTASEPARGSAGKPLPHALAKSHGPQAFLVVLDGRSTSAVYKATRRSSSAAAASSAAKSRKVAITKAQDALIGKLPAKTHVLYRTHAAIAGVAVSTDPRNFGKLRSLTGVASVHPIAKKSLDNAYAVPFQGGAAAWQAHGGLGDGVRVAVIDTGVDYTHANFGGEGTVQAFEDAQAADGNDPNFGHPTDKVVGGYDFAGDDYNADISDATDPDPYPLDCNGHGSHVAGTVAGYGVKADGSTYDGVYDASTDFDALKIGPGMAPKAKIYAYRVFGCEGTTNLVVEAIDRAVDPDNDGDPSDHVDVINMSLGSDYGSINDGDTVAARAAAAAGVVVANSAGNSGDSQDVSGSPGNAPSSITAANTVDASEVTDRFDYQIDANPTSNGSASRAVLYEGDWDTDDVTGPMAILPNAAGTAGSIGDACDPLTGPQSAAVTGKVAVVKWTQEALECGSITRGANLRAGGAIGFVFANSSDHFDAGINGDTDIPGVLLAKTPADAIKTALNGGHTVTAQGTVANGISATDTDLNDTVNSSSSRGIHSAGNMKPDIAAVGTSVFSTGVGTGTEGASFTGTSMASPMVAGSAALVVQEHPSWTPEQVKAALMNTAGNDLHVNPDPGDPGDIYAPNRVGAGRLQVDDALDTDVVAYNSDDHGVVSVSFGPVEVSEATTLTKHIKVENTGTGSHTYAVSYDPIDEVPGVSYSVSPSSVTLASGQSATVTVTLSAPDPKALTKAVDPTQGRLDQWLPYPQDTLTDASGRVLLTPTAGGGPELRVPVYAAPRPTSTLTQESELHLATGTDTGTLHLTGDSVGQVPGENGYGDADPDNDIYSMLSAFELSAVSDESPQCSVSVTEECWTIPEDRAADIQYVGVSSDIPDYVDPLDGQAYIAISTHKPWSTPSNNSEFDVYIDVDGDNAPDLVAYNFRLYNGEDPTDVFVSELVDLNLGAVVDDELLNGRFGDLDTAVYDSDTLVMPLWADVLHDYGVDEANPTINFGVLSFSDYQGSPVDAVGIDPDTGDVSLSANVYEPAITATDQWDSSQLLFDETDGPITVTRNPDSYVADGGLGILMTHFHNAVGNKAQVVDVVLQSTVTGSHTPEPSTFGTASTLTVSVTGDGAPATGTVTVKEGGTTLGTANLSGAGTGQVTLPANLPVGAHSLTLSYSGDDSYEPSTGMATATVAKATGATVTGTHDPEPSAFGAASSLTVHVASPAGTPTGSVTVKEGGTTLGTAPLDGSGSGEISLPDDLAVGAHSLTLDYSGDGSFAASSGMATATVAKATGATVTGSHSPEPSTFGTASSLAVHVTSPAGNPTGSVTVKEGGTTLGTGTLASGTATVSLPATLAAGAHTLTLEYSGDGSFDAATGSATATVAKASTTTSATASPKKIKKGQSFAVTATVTASGATPAGTVQVMRGSKLLGSGTLGADGKVTISITKKMAKKLKKGKNVLTVQYLGGDNFLASEGTVTVKVKKHKKKKHH